MENAIFSLFNNQHGKESDPSRHGLHHVCTCLIYRKIPVISPGLKQLRKGFWAGLINVGTYIRGETYWRNKKNFSKRATAVLIEIHFYVKKS